MKNAKKPNNGGVKSAFEELGFPPAEAENLKHRTLLMAEIREQVKRRKLTQKKAAVLLGVTQSRVSDIMTGSIRSFTIDALVKMLAKFGLSVEVKVKKPQRRKQQAA